MQCLCTLLPYWRYVHSLSKRIFCHMIRNDVNIITHLVDIYGLMGFVSEVFCRQLTQILESTRCHWRLVHSEHFIACLLSHSPLTCQMALIWSERRNIHTLSVPREMGECVCGSDVNCDSKWTVTRDIRPSDWSGPSVWCNPTYSRQVQQDTCYSNCMSFMQIIIVN